MARITVEDCLENVKNRFELVMIAAKRARQLMRGSAEPRVAWENDKATVVALREIAMGYTDFSDAHHSDSHHVDHMPLSLTESHHSLQGAANNTDNNPHDTSAHEISTSGHQPESE